MLLLLAGCLLNSDAYEQRLSELTDADGDGYPREDECDDDDASVFPGADELCDGLDQNCDGVADEDPVDGAEWFQDADGDRFGGEASEWACEAPSGFVTLDGDCDDEDAEIFPGAEERCDQVDEDCDGEIDDDATDASTWFKDGDADGYGDATVTESACEAPPGFVSNAADCDDSQDSFFPGADDRCNGMDEDCDGEIDANPTDPTAWFEDWDRDGYGDPSVTESACEAPPGFVATGDDCDDSEDSIFPGADERCDDVDQDCDGDVDDDATDATTWFGDGDLDGYGAEGVIESACDAPAGFVATADDCDDGNGAIFPGAEERCDEVDQDCDGSVDDNATDAIAWFEDGDLDGYGGEDVTESACEAPPGFVENADDCDDSDGAISPAAEERCDDLDQDCDGDIDEDAIDVTLWFEDGDADGYGDASVTESACEAPAGFVGVSDDCDDEDGSIFPGAEERCDDVDEDCNGDIDDNATDAVTWFGDGDLDGYGDPSITESACEAPSGFIGVAADCDDDDEQIFPGAEERCDDVDEDCNGDIDDDATDAIAWFEDGDVDGYGDPGVTESACEAPAGFVGNADDCDDSDDSIYSGAPDDWYDGVDANCDDADDYDADGDLDRAEDWGGTDCDDEDPLISGEIDEGWADAGVDNNCDGSIEDQALYELSEIGTRIDGTTADGSFGVTVLAVPAGWVDAEAVLLAAAPFTSNGDVYGWRASSLAGTPTLTTADWHLTGANADDYMGVGMAWAGDVSEPLVAIASEGAEDRRGTVEIFDDLAGPPVFAITGGMVDWYLGMQMVSGHDHDGDGVSDIVATAPVDSRIAVSAGSAFVFLAPGDLSGSLSTADADVEFTTTYAGASLSVDDVGDVDGDGVGDLGFSQDIPYSDGPGGLLVSSTSTASGIFDVERDSSAQVYGGPFRFGQAWDPDGDGAMNLLACSGGIHDFALPLSGVVTSWDDAEQSLLFAEDSPSVRWIRSDVEGFATHNAFLAASDNFDGSRGMVSVQSPYWADGQTIEDASFLAVGDAAGDEAGTGFDVLDWDADGVLDLAMGAPLTDSGASAGGSVYLIPGPR